MGVFNSGLQSMTPVYDEGYQASLTAAASVTVIDYSGSGRLMTITWYHATVQDDVEIGITVDGGSEDKADLDGTNALVSLGYMESNAATAGKVALSLEFTTSLVVKIYNGNAAAKNTGGTGYYGILSHEIDRIIIPAGDPIPHRNYTSDKDVMCIMIKGSGRIGSRLIYPVEETINLKSLEVQESQFITDLNKPVRKFVKKPITGTKQIIIDGTYYDITVNNGVIELTSAPYLITRDAFIDRFTPDEITNIINASHEHPNGAIRKGLQDFVFQIQSRQKINLRWVALQTKVNQLHSVAGLIASHRPAQILATA